MLAPKVTMTQLDGSSVRNLVVLFVCMSAALAGAPIVVLAGGLIGQTLAPTAALATLPIATLIIGTAAASVPAALIMQRIGRRRGFALGAALGAVACAVAMQAITQGSFMLFATGTFLLGANLAFVQQYRFAAVETVPTAFAGQAISIVMLGGVVAGFFGPELVRWTRDAMPTLYAGSFFALGAIYVAIAVIMLVGLRDVAVEARTSNATGRTLREIAAQPSFRASIAAAATASGVMVLVMTATPISMHVLDGHSVDGTAMVIKSHMIAMFLPSVVSGFLISRIGTVWLIRGGMLAMVGTVVAGLSSHSLTAYWTALVLLGLGWNLLFLSATVQLTRSYRPEERFRAQALNDFLVFGVQAAGALAAGSLLYRGGWNAVNLLAFGALIVLFVTIRAAARRQALASAPQPVPSSDATLG